MNIICSACLLGHPCRYDGRSCENAKVTALAKDHNLIPVCPEMLGGMECPRTPCEQQGDQVINKNGENVTDFFKEGALEALRIAIREKADLAILQPRSPSCGKGMIYDGSFCNKLIEGDGIFTQMLEKEKIPVLSADQL